MKKLEIETKVKEIFALQFGEELENITLEENIISDLHADSLDSVELIMSVEDRFDIDITDEDANNLLTPGAVVDYVERKLADDSSK